MRKSFWLTTADKKKNLITFSHFQLHLIQLNLDIHLNLWLLHPETSNALYQTHKSLYVFVLNSLSEPTISICRQAPLYEQLVGVQLWGCFTWATGWAAFYRYGANRYACTVSFASNLDLAQACGGSEHCVESGPMTLSSNFPRRAILQWTLPFNHSLFLS